MSELQGSPNSKKQRTVMITGGSGLIGMHLTSLLLSEGYKVCHLSRQANQFGRVRVYRWDPERRIIDPEVLKGVDCIVHLAGTNIGEKRWTRHRMDEIRSSRIDSAQFLYDTVRENGIRPGSFVSASGISYYGTLTSEKIYTVADPPASDFLGNVCHDWENRAELFGGLGIRSVRIRSGVVLTRHGGVLPRLMMTAPYGFMVQLGSGRQYMPWIHILDLCRLYLKAIEDNSLSGPVNAVSPHHVSHRELVRILLEYASFPRLVLPMPGFLLKAVMGEVSGVVLQGSRISSQELSNSGFRFEFEKIEDACRDLLAGIPG